MTLLATAPTRVPSTRMATRPRHHAHAVPITALRVCCVMPRRARRAQPRRRDATGYRLCVRQLAARTVPAGARRAPGARVGDACAAACRWWRGGRPRRRATAAQAQGTGGCTRRARADGVARSRVRRPRRDHRHAAGRACRCAGARRGLAHAAAGAARVRVAEASTPWRRPRSWRWQDRDGRNAIALACLAEGANPVLLQRMSRWDRRTAADGDGRRRSSTRRRPGAGAGARARSRLSVAVQRRRCRRAVRPPTSAFGLLADSRAGRYDGSSRWCNCCRRRSWDACCRRRRPPPSAERVDGLLDGARRRHADRGRRRGGLPPVVDGPPALRRCACCCGAVSRPPPRRACPLPRGLCPRRAGRRALEQFALELLAQGADPFAPRAPARRGIAVGPPGWLRLLDALLVLGVDPTRATATA